MLRKFDYSLNRFIVDQMNMDAIPKLPKSRGAGESKNVVTIDRPSEFGEKFQDFISSLGIFKVIGVTLKADPPFASRKPKGKAKRRQFEREYRFRTERLLYEDPRRAEMQAIWNEANDQNGNNAAGSEKNSAGNGDQNINGDGGWTNPNVEGVVTEADLCEAARLKSQDYGRIALVAISSLRGRTLIIRTCQFVHWPDELINLLQGKEYLKIAFGAYGFKYMVSDKHGFFMLNYVDPRNPLQGWPDFMKHYPFERFGLYSVASYLFEQEMQNQYVAACISSMWSAQELKDCLKAAAVMESQLNIDVFAEICVRMLDRRPRGYALSTNCYKDAVFFEELGSLAHGHIDAGFEMRRVNSKVFSTDKMQRRFAQRMTGLKYVRRQRDGFPVADEVPANFIDRVRLRKSKSTVDDICTSGVVYASFDPAIVYGGQTIIATKKIGKTVWKMEIHIRQKVPDGYPTGILGASSTAPITSTSLCVNNTETKFVEDTTPESGNAAAVVPISHSMAAMACASVPSTAPDQPAMTLQVDMPTQSTLPEQSLAMEPREMVPIVGALEIIPPADDEEDDFWGPQYSPNPDQIRFLGRGRGRSLDGPAVLPSEVSVPSFNGSTNYDHQPPQIPGRGRGLTNLPSTLGTSQPGGSTYMALGRGRGRISPPTPGGLQMAIGADQSMADMNQIAHQPIGKGRGLIRAEIQGHGDA